MSRMHLGGGRWPKGGHHCPVCFSTEVARVARRDGSARPPRPRGRDAEWRCTRCGHEWSAISRKAHSS